MNKQLSFVLVASAFLVTGSISNLLAADVTGTWRSEFDSQIGPQIYTFTFKQDGAKLTGKAASQAGDRKREAELKEGKVDGDTVAFVEIVSIQDQEIRISYTSKLSTDGNEIKFTLCALPRLFVPRDSGNDQRVGHPLLTSEHVSTQLALAEPLNFNCNRLGFGFQYPTLLPGLRSLGHQKCPPVSNFIPSRQF